MAVYEFTCENNHLWEKEASMNKPPQRMKCPTCKSDGKRVLYAPATIFKGSGWHKTKKKVRDQFNDKSIARKFAEESIEASKKRMKSGGEHYSRMVPNWDKLENLGEVKRKNKFDADKALRDAKDVGTAVAAKHRK